MVRKTFGEITALCKPVHCSIENWKILSDEHRPCLFNFIPVLKEYVADLNEVWMNFIGFVFKTQVYEENYVGIRGIEYLNLRRYENEGRLLKKGPSYAIIKKKNGIAKVVVGCYLPRMSLRLVISPNDNTDIGQDDEYADEAVGYMNKQLEVCWKVFPRLLMYNCSYRMYVRKFKNMMCYLSLIGLPETYDYSRHCVPMKEQLNRLKMYNFNDSLLKEIRASFHFVTPALFLIPNIIRNMSVEKTSNKITINLMERMTLKRKMTVFGEVTD